jgi:Sortase domain
VGQVQWRRTAGFRVVMHWPQDGPVPPPPQNLRARAAGIAGVVLLLIGAVAVGIAVIAQQHAPQPSASAAGTLGMGYGRLTLRRSVPVSVSIPAIGVSSRLLRLGLRADGTVAVPVLPGQAGRAAWFDGSVTPGQAGAAVIEGHLDSYRGPAVFFRLGALRPGDGIEVRLADGVTAVFSVTGVRQYLKSRFPAQVIYTAPGFAALRLITCGGSFDDATGHYRSSTVVFAALTSARRTGHHPRQPRHPRHRDR